MCLFISHYFSFFIALPFLNNTEFFLFPLALVVFIFVLNLVGYPFGFGWNASRIMANWYFAESWNDWTFFHICTGNGMIKITVDFKYRCCPSVIYNLMVSLQTNSWNLIGAICNRLRVTWKFSVDCSKLRVRLQMHSIHKYKRCVDININYIIAIAISDFMPD